MTDLFEQPTSDPGVVESIPSCDERCAEDESAARLQADNAWLLGLARRLVRDEEQARDLSQDAWLATLRRPLQPRELRSWLTATARKLAARSWSRRRDISLTGVEDSLLDDSDPYLQAAETDNRILLYEALELLGQTERELILWRCHEGLTYSQIAERLGMTRQSAAYRVERAVQSLRVILERRAKRSSLFTFLAPALHKFQHRLARCCANPFSSAVVSRLGALAAVILGVFSLAAANTSWPLQGPRPLPGLTRDLPLTSPADISAPPANPGLFRGHAVTRSRVTDFGRGPFFPRFTPSSPSRPTRENSLAASATEAQVHVSGTLLLDGEPAEGWEAMLIPQTEGKTVLRPGGVVPIEDGHFEVAGDGSGNYLLRLMHPLPNQEGIFYALSVAQDTTVEIALDTGAVEVKTSLDEDLVAIAEGSYGLFLCILPVEDGLVHFPLVPATTIDLRLDDDLYDLRDGTLVGQVAVPAGGTVQAEFD